MLRRMFVGACRENHKCVACAIRTGQQKFDWTNTGNLTLYFHRGKIYRTLNGA